VPLGYKIEDKRMVIDPDTALLARDIFRQYVACRSIRALRQYVMDKHGIVYSHTGLRELLSNERYIGMAHDQANFCEPLIDRASFEIAQSAMRERAQRNGSTRTDWVYLFAGLVYCAECGNRLSVHTVDKKYIYYRCTRYDKLHMCVHKKRTSELVLEEWLLNNMLSRVSAFNTHIASADTPRVGADESKIKRKMEKLKDLYLNDLIERPEYEAEYIALRDTLIATKQEAPAPQQIDLTAMRAALSDYKMLSREAQKEFWSRTVRKIIITNDEQISIVLSSPYSN
ncbi:MAG TPA: recombinase zinc beta ribbon domain-containing protein, partial [Clostridia bacterium]|nr:recombinase zinc beta ribbon domain-containing protein [Clostridia bacterium]